MHLKLPRLLAASLATLWLVGCAFVSPDGGFAVVAQQTGEHLGATPSYQRTPADIQAATARVAEIAPELDRLYARWGELESGGGA